MGVFVRSLLVPICLVQLSLAAEIKIQHVRNFDEVNEHLYRGAEPSPVGLQELGAMGVKMIIDLRETSQSTEFEKHEAEKLRIKYVNVPFPPFSAPKPDEMDRVLSLLTSNGSQTVFVHCRRGKDRTGTVIACYRVQHDHWDNQSALAEAKKHGMSFTERGMRSFILNFKPVVLPQLVQVTP